jgi:type IV pilus assembly protein PilO
MEVSSEIQAKIDQVAKLPKPVRMGISVGIAVAISVFYFFGVYQEKSTELSGLRAQELELQRKLSEVRSVAANIGAFESEIDDLQSQLKIALRQLPNKQELEVLLTDISNLGKKAGIEMKSFKRNNESNNGFYAEVPVALELEGEYHDIAKFFELISKLPRIVNMGGITIGVARESQDGTVLKVSGTATTFRFVGKS